MIRFQPPGQVPLVGPLELSSHGLFFLLGAVAAFLYARRRVPEEHRDMLEDAACWMTAGGILGARLLFVAVNPDTVRTPLDLVAVWDGGLISYGGMVGALLAWWLFLRAKGLPLAILNDAIAPAALLGWGVGRIGCLLAWESEYGTVTQVPWAFVVGTDPPRHPVMGYEALGLLLAAFLVARLARTTRAPATALALLAYGLVRFHVDFFRDYTPEWLQLGSQAISLAMAVGGLVVLRWRGRHRA